MARTTDAQAFLPLVDAHRDALASLVVDGFLIRDDPKAAEVKGPVYPLPAPTGAHFGAECVKVAQFWAHGRLWRFSFDFDYNEGVLDSAGPEHGLVDGQDVEGNSAWVKTSARFLVPVDGRVWKAHHAIQDLAGALQEGADLDGFLAAMALRFGTAPLSFESLNRLGGAEDPIQWPHDPVCPTCAQPMAFLAQISGRAGFEWGDAGAASLFACLTHPEHTSVGCDMH